MIKLIRHYSLEIYSIISILFLLIASLMGDLSFVQNPALILLQIGILSNIELVLTLSADNV